MVDDPANAVVVTMDHEDQGAQRLTTGTGANEECPG
jgi:hypothetical protein